MNSKEASLNGGKETWPPYCALLTKKVLLKQEETSFSIQITGALNCSWMLSAWKVISRMSGSILTSLKRPGRVTYQKNTQICNQDIVACGRSLTSYVHVILDRFAIIALLRFQNYMIFTNTSLLHIFVVDKERSWVTRAICNSFVHWKDNHTLVSELDEVLRWDIS